jgi:hypothetical protein
VAQSLAALRSETVGTETAASLDGEIDTAATAWRNRSPHYLPKQSVPKQPYHWTGSSTAP